MQRLTRHVSITRMTKRRRCPRGRCSETSGGLRRDGESEERDGRLCVGGVVVGRHAAVQPVVGARRRTHEVHGQFGQRAVGDVEMSVELHRGRRADAVAVLRQRDPRRAGHEHAAAHARRAAAPRRHLHATQTYYRGRQPRHAARLVALARTR